MNVNTNLLPVPLPHGRRLLMSLPIMPAIITATVTSSRREARAVLHLQVQETPVLHYNGGRQAIGRAASGHFNLTPRAGGSEIRLSKLIRSPADTLDFGTF